MSCANATLTVTTNPNHPEWDGTLTVTTAKPPSTNGTFLSNSGSSDYVMVHCGKDASDNPTISFTSNGVHYKTATQAPGTNYYHGSVEKTGGSDDTADTWTATTSNQ